MIRWTMCSYARADTEINLNTKLRFQCIPESARGIDAALCAAWQVLQFVIEIPLLYSHANTFNKVAVELDFAFMLIKYENGEIYRSVATISKIINSICKFKQNAGE